MNSCHGLAGRAAIGSTCEAYGTSERTGGACEKQVVWVCSGAWTAGDTCGRVQVSAVFALGAGGESSRAL